ncbi:MAG: YafY family protein [Balneolaceae bacterium]
MSRLKSSERRMKIILMLQESSSRITVNRLAETFGVSRRTIFRDLNALSDLNVPVTWEEYSGYGIMPGYKVPPLMFTSRELATIMVGLNFVKSQVDKGLVEDADGVELKIKNVLPDKLKGFMESLADRTIVDPFLTFGRKKREGGSWYLIGSAISQNKSIRFQYRSRHKESHRERFVDPYLLVFYQDHWNVIGYSREREDIRNFILDRMSELEISGHAFRSPGKIDVEALIFRFDGPAKEVMVEVATSQLERFEGDLPTKIIRKYGVSAEKIKVTFRFDNLDYLNQWLLRYADDVKILAPKELIGKRNSLLKRMMAR